MTYAAPENRLIDRLTIVLGLPDHVEPTKYLAEIHKLTAHFPRNVMDRAADRLIVESGRKWPTVKQMMDALVDAQDAIAATNGSASTEKKAEYPWEVHAEQARAWAEDYMRVSILADEARHNGWADKLRAYARSYARETLRTGNTPMEPRAYRPPHTVLADYRQEKKRERARA